MAISTRSIIIRAHGPANLFELAPYIDELSTSIPAGAGRLFVFSVGSTGAVIGLPEDAAAHKAFVDWVQKAIPFNADCRHPGNAFAHLRSTLLKAGVSLPMKNKLVIGLKPYLLENTAGRKSRPLIFTVVRKDTGVEMGFYRDEFSVDGNGWIDMIDVTGRVMEIAAASGQGEGQVFVSAGDERSAIVTIENDMRLLLDTADFIDGLVRRGGAVNRLTAGHVAAAMLGQHVAVPLVGGRLEVGTWQQIMAVDLAEGGRKRIIVDVLGE